MINTVNFRVVNFYLLNVLVHRVFSHFFFLPSKKEKEKYFQLGDAVSRPYDIRAPIKHGKKFFFHADSTDGTSLFAIFSPLHYICPCLSLCCLS